MTSKAHSTTQTSPRSILYVGPTDVAAAERATALEGVRVGPERTVHATATVGEIPDWVSEVDCVVVDGDSDDELAAIADACGSTPLVVFGDGPYAEATIPAAVDGHVRRDAGDAHAHLVDEIERVCAQTRDDRDGTAGTEAEAEATTAGDESDEGSNGEGAANPGVTDGDAPESAITDDATSGPAATNDATQSGDTGGVTTAVPADPGDDVGAGRDERLDTSTAGAVFDTTARIASCRERDDLFERLVEGAVEVLGFEHCWLATINFGELVPRAVAPDVPDEAVTPVSLEEPLGVAFRAREPIRIADLATYEWIEPPFDGARSLCSVPVGEVGVLHVAATEADAFDGADVALLEGLCEFAAAILERNWTERGVTNERNRLRREHSRVLERYERIKDERDALFTLFRNVSEPTLRYDLEDGEAVVSGINATFEAVFGVDRDALIGDAVTDVALPSGLADDRRTLSAALEAGDRRHLETHWLTPDGVREFELTVVPLEVGGDDSETDPADSGGGILVYEDVTQQHRRERELLAARRRLEEVASRISDDVQTSLNTARGYLELAEKTGDAEHFDVVATAHERLAERLQGLIDVAVGDDDDREPVVLTEVATRAWLTSNTDDARLVTEGDLVFAADREAVTDLFEYVLQATIALEGVEESDARVTVTVGAADDGFYVAGSRPATADADGEDVDDELEPDPDPDPGRLDAAEDADGTEFGLEFVERIADDHGWDVGVAADDDGTAIAIRGVESLDLE
ncbi:GAF domain-containing protein [Natrarchaeobaculum aegyptiacum]|uniref:PAS domain-containing protein n=1 Tax=Natrarchaeobaculum aegyptiacum TaxID=745377 RepID=A0A2Z2HRD9_9EURY|nr:GAF domain-containing protein [Natrarchaeobaculum aegyptiacum]ARS89720.1 hypothetical protein B1756_08185 [Natrarchaeobaculum aegyptiacum]